MNPAITVYTKPNCQQCNAVKRFLKASKVEFYTDDLTLPENAQNLAWFKSQGFLSAPITVYGAHTVPGFNPGALEALVTAYRADRVRISPLIEEAA